MSVLKLPVESVNFKSGILVSLIGANGSMGKRYRAILDWLRYPYVPYDVETGFEETVESAKACSHVIVASPTDTHMKYLYALLPYRKPVLVEKPVCKNLDELIDLHGFCLRHSYSFNMMAQYKELVTSRELKPSHYAYFRHGPDGFPWDGLQIIGLDCSGKVSLYDKSPIWDCVINGQRIHLSNMDGAYVSFARKFIEGTLDQPMLEIIDWHKKAHEWQSKRASSEFSA